jgi:hypothetical protein
MAEELDPELVKFWHSELAGIFQRLSKETYLLAGVQTRYSRLIAAVNNKYMRTVDFHIVCAELGIQGGEGRLITFGSSVADGQPSVSVLVPAARKMFEGMKQEDSRFFRRLFENFVIISFLHELDHLLLGITVDAGNLLVSIMEQERLAWAETCEKTIRLFDENGERLYSGDRAYYATWVRSGRNADSKPWRDFIAKMYGGIKPQQNQR